MCVENYELKPCPFCGGTATFFVKKSKNKTLWYIYVKCDFCGAQSKTMFTETDPKPLNFQTWDCSAAIDFWNNRVKDRFPLEKQ